MLDVAKVVTRSAREKFDNVTYFDYTEEAVVATQAAIPGAVGFPGDLLRIALLDDEEGDNVVDDPAPLAARPEAEDSAETRAKQRRIEAHRGFIKCFPFDVMNLDLEEFFFKPNDPIPGKMVRTLEKICEWQKREGADSAGRNVKIDSFSLMFTTRLGPRNLSEDYLGAIQGALENNLQRGDAVREAFETRVGHADVARLRGENFDVFFRLGLPKILSAILKKHGWRVEDEHGIRVYSFLRGEEEPQYEMLHLVMHVRREPALVPGNVSAEVEAAYARTIERLFRDGHFDVTPAIVEARKEELEASLTKIFARRRKYTGES